MNEHRSKGFGSALVNESITGVKIRQCSELYLEVRCSNNDAVRLYEKLGFSITPRLKAYYRDGEDAYVMAVDLATQNPITN
jgi:ribosomal-protein-alanine N-acetyltransferase